MKLLYKLLFFAPFIGSCSTGPQPIAYGKDACDYCRMTIMDQKYGGEIIIKKGKLYKFDAPECMAHYYRDHHTEVENMAALLITCYDSPGKMTPVSQAIFMQDEAINSPMGAHTATFPDEQSARKVFPDGERIMSWEELVKNIR